MQGNSLSLKTLVSNAGQGITSRQAYVRETIQKIADMPLYDFVDRENNELYTMNTILNTLGLPQSCMEKAFKDLIYVIVSYKDSEKEYLRKKARQAMW